MRKSNLITTLFQYIDQLLHDQLFHGYQMIADAIQVPLASAIILSFMLLGFSMMQGWLQWPWTAFLQLLLRITLIYTFVMNWHYFSLFFVDGLSGTISQLSQLFNKAIHAPTQDSQMVTLALQALLTRFTRLGLGVWNQGSLYHFAPLLTGFIIWLFGNALVVVAALQLMTAKLLVNLLLMLAPLFAAFSIFKTTEGFFQRWLALLIGYSFIQLFVPLMTTLLLRISNLLLNQSYLAHPETVTVTGFIPVVMIASIGIGLLHQAVHLALSIGDAVGRAIPIGQLASSIVGRRQYPFSTARQVVHPPTEKATHSSINSLSAINERRGK